MIFKPLETTGSICVNERNIKHKAAGDDRKMKCGEEDVHQCRINNRSFQSAGFLLFSGDLAENCLQAESADSLLPIMPISNN